ncbi:hypothetical protein [Stenotrophomonas hibiscicola]|uniref:hypothetical protein n=1 Tax=Stenotrophomonas hibiscicola TaxID=86189 RepID=UPI0012AC66CC|nr:hypothetical protein [[Pseudomonas] hibiscicola]
MNLCSKLPVSLHDAERERLLVARSVLIQRSQEAFPERSNFERESDTNAVKKCHSFDAVNICIVPRARGTVTDIGHHDLCNEWVLNAYSCLQLAHLTLQPHTAPPPTTAALEITIPAESTCSGDIDISY